MPITEQFSYRNTHRDRERGGNLSSDLSAELRVTFERVVNFSVTPGAS